MMRGSLRGLGFLLILVAIWAAVSRLVHNPLFPTPAAVADSVRAGLADGTLVRATLTTVARLMLGYTISLVGGVLAGVALARVRLVKELFGPIVLGLSAVPSICWLPLAAVWFGLSEWAIQTVVVLGAFLPIAVATESAVRHVPPQIIRAARTMGARGGRMLVSVVIPAAFPGILAGAKLGWTFALRSLMAGELMFISGGLGQLLDTGRDLGDTGLVVSVILVIVVLGRLSESLLFGRLDAEVGRRWGAEVA